jgi:hypothetical protein
MPVAKAARPAFSCVLVLLTRPSGSPMKMVEPAIPPRSTICAVDSVRPSVSSV